MKTKTLLIFSLFFVGIVATAQSTYDKLLFEEAQEAYAIQNYKYCLQKIEELNQRGVKGLLILHLKIVATNKIAEAHLNNEMIVQFKKDVEYYLKNYDNEDFLQQYKEVYEISKRLSDKRYDENYMAYTKAIYNNDLFSLKGDVVLVHFWASWSAPDRIINKKIESLYEKYKEKGLDIYSISLDTDSVQWLNAIKQDELTWSYHYTDLKSWNSPLVNSHNINKIPHVILFDRKSNKTISDLPINKLEVIIAEILN